MRAVKNKLQCSNILADIPNTLAHEWMQILAEKSDIKIERIVSKGHQSPASGWYDQSQDEWVMVVQGQARLSFSQQHDITLSAGDYLHIPAHTKHKVAWTDPQQPTIWLAIHF